MVARKLTEEQVNEIRQNMKDTHKKLAEAYKVSPSTIKRIRTGELYKKVYSFDAERKKQGW